MIGPHQLNYSPATNTDGEASLPDTVVCDGPAYRNQLADWGVPPGRMVIGGSLRIRRAEGDSYHADASCFVPLSAHQTIARQMMWEVEAAAAKGFTFLVKDHPMYPLTFREDSRIRRAMGTLNEQSSLSAVFYSTGTSGLEALLAGLPTFRLLPEDRIAVDVLPEFVSAVPVTAGGLADALSRASRPAPIDWEDVLSPVDWDLWRRLLAAGSALGRANGPDASGVENKKIA